MTSLLIDAGNTSCKYAIWSGGVLGPVMRDDGHDVARSAGYVLNGVCPDMIILSSVRGRDAAVEAVLSGMGGHLIVLGRDTVIPISIRYDTPGTLGPDRIAAAVGAHFLFPEDDILVFDFGTAITIDRVTKEGEFAGGNISIGLRSRLKALNILTARLPEVHLEDGGGCGLGTSTEDALRRGAISGTMFEIEGYMKCYSEHKIVFSGGDSIFLAKRMKNPIFADCNLVLKGLAYIAEYNAQM